MSEKINLLIKSNKAPKQDNPNLWKPFEGVEAFINDIDTSDGNKNASSEKFNLLISGVPSPWARVKLTSYALNINVDPSDARTLMLCYKYMKEEWRGLIAAYALKPDRFVLTEPIELKPKSIEERRGKFDILSAYSEMLFEDKNLWKHEFGRESSPYIQLLYYKEKTESDKNESRVLVGATSPYTLFFTSTNYTLLKSRGEIPWITESGKFTDPTLPEYSNKLEAKDFRKLYSFLSNIDKQRKNYLNKLQEVCGEDKQRDIDDINEGLMNAITEWKSEIASILKEKEVNEVPVIIKESVRPKGPLSILFTTSYKYYWKSGAFYAMDQGDDTVIINNVADLFIDSNLIIGWKGLNDTNRDYEKAPVYYLKAMDVATGDPYYFAIPFSKFALSFLNQALDQIINNTNDKVKYSAVKKGNKLVVVLIAQINNEDIDILTREFDVIEPESNGKVFVWPNFSSKIWKNYYYYSEYPTNDVGIRMIPEFEDDGTGFNFEEMLKNNKSELDKYFLVHYPVNQVSTTKHRYEIIKTEVPLKSLTVRIKQDDKELDAGYLILKHEDSANGLVNGMKVIDTDVDALGKASVGIDFGSTNTCVYYKPSGSKASPIPFENRRLALVGFDNLPKAQANKDELYFISNEKPLNDNGQVKSWLHQHDRLYTDESKTDTEIVGGVPVNETNILVHSMDENIINTNAGVLNYNMKWLSGNEGAKKKTSFIKMIWIQTCADLFAMGYKPSELRWSFPSAMGKVDISQLKKIYRDLKATPIEGCFLKNMPSFTEAEAVCSYALSKDEALSDSKLFLGIDIGGSTSDILLLGRTKDPSKGYVDKLLSQCSIRLAAGCFFKAINNSAKFRKSLYNFHNSRKTKVTVLHIDDVINTDPQIYSRAPYYLNNIFDQLKGQSEFVSFYSYLQKDVPFVFTLPAYITGVLVFYAGLLTRNVIKKQNLDGVREIHLRYYGKGGRLFEWLFDVYEDETKTFLRKCLKAGLQLDNIKIFYDNLEDDQFNEDGSKLENKSEVAKGLVEMNAEIAGIYVEDEEEDAKIRVVDNSEVVGEKGVKYFRNGEEVTLDEEDIIDDNLYENVNNFMFPSQFENFSTFIDLYTDFIRNEIGIIEDVSDLNKGKSRVSNVGAFISNDPEYVKYKNCSDKSQASYRMPIFIAASLYYLDTILLPSVFKKDN
ncbi:hypothetical protein [uncultured Bacteroides sp.]|uniref:hypothetical protein n=1 Tax=uncultured Bacteroides sp. TaxID=162156 RepID=UPI00262034E5|nr:hypothetical protein [uncultured Bacteroides sp.]